MSRLAKFPVVIPSNVKIKVEGACLKVEGPKGKLERQIPDGVEFVFNDAKVTIKRLSNAKQHRANHGTIRSHLANMITGVTDGHKRDLEIQGLGFRAQMQGKKVVMGLGFSHPVEYDVPNDVTVTVPNQTSITVEGIDTERVGQVAASLRALKKVEPYKGKGIRYVGENVRRKQGKSVSK